MATASELESVCFKPPSDWHDVFVANSSFVEMYFHMLGLFHNSTEISSIVAQGLVQLASLTGSVFSNDQEKVLYLQLFLTRVSNILR